MQNNTIIINGKEVNVETVMNKENMYFPTAEEIATLEREMSNVLTHYEYPEGDALRTVIKEFFFKKGWLIKEFTKHPNYNGNYQIVFRDIDCNRYVNKDEAIGVLGDLKRWVIMEYTGDEYYLISRALTQLMDNIEREETPNLLSEDSAKYINDAAEVAHIDFKVFPEAKLSKVLAKLGKRFHFEKFVDVRETSFTTNDGDIVTRHKDYGWNHIRSTFGDAINPLTIKMTGILSVNPVDFWKMSMGSDWRSCMMIDKRNVDGNPDSDHNYYGMYSGGATSYMLDNCTLVFYYLPADWCGNHPEYEPKVKRCLFYLGEDKLVQSRVYPDGRDGGDRSLAGDIRTLVQKVIADIFDVPNFWDNKKGIANVSEFVETCQEAVHYEDYKCCDDVNVSIMKRIDGHVNRKKIIVGARQICPCCGDKFNNQESIVCGSCLNEEDDGCTCYNCGCHVPEYEVLFDEDGDAFCSDCASWCEYCGTYHMNSRFEHIMYTAPLGRRVDRNVCRYERENDYVFFEAIGEYVHEDDIIYTEEGNMHFVGDNDYVMCDGCGAYHEKDSVYKTTEGTPLCRNCAREREYYIERISIGRTIYTEEEVREIAERDGKEFDDIVPSEIIHM